MTAALYDVVGLGNAIVDVISKQDDDFLAKWGINKDAMNLIEEDRADLLTKASVDALETSGGSGANTIAGIASFGGQAAYIGKVADDRLGEVFKTDMEKVGVPFPTSPLTDGPATARSIIFVTPDGKRSMNTFLGASVEFSPSDVDRATVEAGGISIWKAICSTRKRPRRHSFTRPKLPTPPDEKCRSLCQTVSALTVTATVSGN